LDGGSDPTHASSESWDWHVERDVKDWREGGTGAQRNGNKRRERNNDPRSKIRKEVR
jgi:hypothetical protein